VLAADVQQSTPPQAGINRNALGGEHPGRKEIAVNPIHRIRRYAAVLVALVGTLLAFAATAPAAFATIAPPGGATGAGPSHSRPVVIHTVVVGGMPGWQIALIAAGAALAAATTAVLLERARAAQRKAVTAAA
jgi:hypothetical protein